MAEQDKRAREDTSANEAQTGQSVQIGVRLQPVEHSDQPIFSNLTAVQGVAGTVFLDFGFVEPQAFGALARRGQSGEKMPETVNGRLACRIAVGVDVAATLARQLNQLLASRTIASPEGSPALAAKKKPK